MRNFVLVRLEVKYCEYLRQFDERVYYNSANKASRPFIGVLFNNNAMLYFAPLSSPKPKHLTMKSAIDFIKIDDGKLGVVNLNNMVPVMESNYSLLDLDNLSNSMENKYNKMLKEQLAWLNSHYVQIRKKSLRLYNWYNNDKLPVNIKNRCCNFKLLESKCMEYNLVNV